MEFENMIMDQDGGGPDQEEEEESIRYTPEPEEPTVCCCCGRSITVEEQTFDCDGCSHRTCVSCRFIENIQCIQCKPLVKTSDCATQVEFTTLNDLYSKCFTRKRFNKDHIVDVELSTEEGSMHKQMCNICKRVFKKSNARYHYACATGEKPHACVECGLKFVKKSHLEAHLNKHYGIRPFKCSKPKCKASFTQKDKLIRHMKSHNKENKLSCPLCDKLYTSQDILNHHMVKVHSSAKQFQCDQCPRTYKYPSSLRIHRLKHQTKRDYMCEVCGKKYALSAQLKVHKRSHVLYNRRPFKCRCGRRFMSRRDKARHELIHSSCHDFECSLCNTTFGRKDNLERHMKNFHQDNPPALKKHGKLVATVAPFNSKPIIMKKEDSTALKKESIKEKTTKAGKPKLKKDKPQANLKQNYVKEVNSTEFNPPKSVKTSKAKSSCNVIKPVLNTTVGSISEVCDNESNQKQSVIVSPQQNVPQNRPSVIKSVPPLLPYRILPPDKRFLKLTGGLSKLKDNCQTQTPSIVKVNNSHAQTLICLDQNNMMPVRDDSEVPTDLSLKIVENPTVPRVRRRIPKDDALNRCFRIIRPLGTDRVEHDRSDTDNVKTIEETPGAVTISVDRKINNFGYRQQQTRSTSAVFTLPSYTTNNLNREIRHNSSNIMNGGRPVEINSRNNSNVGGPSLSDSVSEMTHEDNFTSSYTSMGEATCSSYTPYFDGEYLRDSMNSFDSNVENLLPNDLDIGFQYIN